MSFFSKLFGHDDSTRVNLLATIRSEISIADAITAHVDWKGRLENYLNGTSEEELDPMIICRDDQCLLGKWIHGPALIYFHKDEGFHTLRVNHANFHFVASKVVKKMQENDRAGAKALMKNEYEHASRMISDDLTKFSNHLNDK